MACNDSRMLPKLAELRRRRGLPHWIVVDEAHYFLRDCHTKPPVDLELAAYLLITYRPSQLYSELVKTLGVIIVTPLTDPGEIRALAAICEAEGMKSEWATLLGGLVIDEAVVRPAKGSLWRTPRRFTISERITSHVRHRAKYLDVPMPEGHAFVFTYHGQPVGKPARTLKEFGMMLERLPIVAIEGHARRGDFSRWIGEVFGDQPLAVAISSVEEAYRRRPEITRGIAVISGSTGLPLDKSSI
jgi:hypothetical protein